jgi:hypothetical protein
VFERRRSLGSVTGNGERPSAIALQIDEIDTSCEWD